MIQGGWEFIRVAYGLVWAVLGFYALSLVLRFRKLQK